MLVSRDQKRIKSGQVLLIKEFFVKTAFFSFVLFDVLKVTSYNPLGSSEVFEMVDY